MAGFNILLAEDNLLDALIITSALDTYPVLLRIQRVWDGEQASDHLRKHGEHKEAPPPDAIILDLEMRKKSGGKVLKEIKAASALQVIATIILTRSEESEDIDICFPHQVNAFSSKLVELQALSRLVAAIAEI